LNEKSGVGEVLAGFRFADWSFLVFGVVAGSAHAVEVLVVPADGGEFGRGVGDDRGVRSGAARDPNAGNSM
jgi:hypothetical protein